MSEKGRAFGLAQNDIEPANAIVPLLQDVRDYEFQTGGMRACMMTIQSST